MSDFTAIGDIGETLKKLLDSDPWTGISPKPEITFKSPKEVKDDGGSANKVSLFLYEIIENPHLRNEEPIRVDDSRLHTAPLVLDLYYLVTPYSDDKTQEKYILGKVMQIFYDHSILGGTILQGSLSGSDEEMRLVPHGISLDDLTKIWNAFQDVAYRLSVAYLVTPVKIDSTRELGMQRVVSKEMNHATVGQRR
ncbi:MAG TPA: DUF4255 domain-containing protein [Dissulfurispiraceae bacterium]|nr:DUF4255 domain-containing protein [Dissulfurispiraceae bacterium]